MRRLLTVMAVVATLIPAMVGSAAAGGSKSDVCHYDADADAYHLINISDNAFDKHLAHGDAAPDSLVPTMSGYKFDANCGATPNVVSGSAPLLLSGWNCNTGDLVETRGSVEWSHELTTLTVTYTLEGGTAGTAYSVGFSTDADTNTQNMLTGSVPLDYEAAIWTFDGNCGGSLSQYLTLFQKFTADVNGDFSETVVLTDVVPGSYDVQFYLTIGWSPKFQTGDFIGDYVTVEIPDYA